MPSLSLGSCRSCAHESPLSTDQIPIPTPISAIHDSTPMAGWLILDPKTTIWTTTLVWPSVSTAQTRPSSIPNSSTDTRGNVCSSARPLNDAQII